MNAEIILWYQVKELRSSRKQSSKAGNVKPIVKNQTPTFQHVESVESVELCKVR